jgi:hypothetical protein
MEELLKKAGNRTTLLAEAFIKCKAYNGDELRTYMRGVKKWYSYVCTECDNISSFPESEKDNYISSSTTRKYSFNVTCPKCGHTKGVSANSREIGIIRADSDGVNFVDLESTNRTYPDSDVITSCKLTDLSYKDIYEHLSKLPRYTYWYCDQISDETMWDNIYRDVITADINNSWHRNLLNFIGSLKEDSTLYNLICYLVAKENKNIIKCIEECTELAALSLLKEQFKHFIKCGCDKSKISQLKMVVKNVKKITKSDIDSGEIFSLPKDVVKKCESLDKYNTLRKIYNKTEDIDDFNKILEGAAISDDPKYLNALRIVLNKIPAFNSKQVANICIMQYAFGGYEFQQTCQALSRNSDKAIENLEFFKPSLREADWVTKNNRWLFARLRDSDAGSIKYKNDLKSIMAKIEPEDRILFEDDTFELETDIYILSTVAEKESIYYGALMKLYEKNIAYIFTNIDKKSYVMARNGGDIIFRGKIV